MHITNTPAALGTLVRATRKAQQLTQQQLAAHSGVGIRFVRELEAGKEGCHIGKAFVVLAMLGLELRVVSRSNFTMSDK